MPLPEGRLNELSLILKQEEFERLVTSEMQMQALVSEISKRTGVSADELRMFAHEVMGDSAETGDSQGCPESGSLSSDHCRMDGNMITPG